MRVFWLGEFFGRFARSKRRHREKGGASKGCAANCTASCNTKQVMSAVECKEPGFYKDFDERTDPGDDFGVETEDFKNADECSYALGKQVRRWSCRAVGRHEECPALIRRVPVGHL